MYNSYGYRIIAHQPFAGREKAIRENLDIASAIQVFERLETRQTVAETDAGAQLRSRIDDLRELLDAYRAGAVTEDHK